MHVFADLNPYICTFANCDMELAQFPTRAAWADHEFSEHRVMRWWECFECTEQCYSEIEWKEHLEYRHRRTFIGAKYHVAEKMALKKRAKAAETEECPLCQVTFGKSRREFVNHVGRHMEEIALIALPREVDEESDAHSRITAAESSSFQSSVKISVRDVISGLADFSSWQENQQAKKVDEEWNADLTAAESLPHSAAVMSRDDDEKSEPKLPLFPISVPDNDGKIEYTNPVNTLSYDTGPPKFLLPGADMHGPTFSSASLQSSGSAFHRSRWLVDSTEHFLFSGTESCAAEPMNQ